MDLWMDVDAALSEVPVNIMPLLDDTDFKSIEGAVAYNASGMTLRWHFVTTAGAYTVTSVTPTTGGDYDWTDQGDSGVYTIEIPASGGASINNDTEGFGWFTGVATGVLPWRGPVIGFRAAGLNNLLIDSAHSATRGLAGTAVPDAAAEAAGGLYTRGTGAGQINQPANGQVDVNVEKWNATNVPAEHTAGYPVVTVKDGTGTGEINTDTGKIVEVSTLTGHTAQTGDNFARLGAPAGASVSADIAAIEAQTDDIGAAGAGLTALASAANLATVDTVVDAILALLDDARTEPGQGAPPVNPDTVTKIDYIYKFLRNKKTQTATTLSVFADDGATVDHKATVSDDATTYTHGEVVSGP